MNLGEALTVISVTISFLVSLTAIYNVMKSKRENILAEGQRMEKEITAQKDIVDVKERLRDIENSRLSRLEKDIGEISLDIKWIKEALKELKECK